jgi:hypothetical protein
VGETKRCELPWMLYTDDTSRAMVGMVHVRSASPSAPSEAFPRSRLTCGGE